MKDPTAAQIADPFGLVGTTLDGQYRVEQVVGEGGYGVVYRGWHLSLEQPIAIKALKVISADDRAVQDALFAKFKDEAKLLYTLSQASLHIVRSMDFGAVTAPTGLWAPYMVLEWLAGCSLADDLAQRRRRGLRGRTLDEALALLAPAAEGLTLAHQRRVAHRDIKPANFFLLEGSEGPRVKVLDFGIAKIIRDGEGPGTRSPFASFTWLYAAPEQLDPRIGQTGLATDVYSFALLLTELLTDRVPTDGRDVVSLLRAAIDPTVRPTPRQRGVTVPDAVELACRRALAVDPNARFSNIGELWAALVSARRASAPPPIPITGTPMTPAGGVVAAQHPSPFAQPSAAPSGPGVFIPSGIHLAPQGPATAGPPRAGSMSPPLAHAPPFAPMTGMVPSRPPLTHHQAAQMSPPRMTPPPGARMTTHPQHRRFVPTKGSAWPVVLAVIGLLFGLMFVATCAAVHAACG